MPVNGDFEVAVNLPGVGDTVPEKGPVLKTKIFSGASGLVPFGRLSNSNLTPSPLPPIYRRRFLLRDSSAFELNHVMPFYIVVQELYKLYNPHPEN